MALRIDYRLGERARSMRSEPTPFEYKLWERLKSSQLGGFKFRRQIALAPYIVDFFCPAIGLIVEVDGNTHDAAADARRDADFVGRGFSVLRFTNAQVAGNIDGVLEAILNQARASPPRFTHPQPPPLKGRGL
ncbi:endonuclease domain-containing protein [Rhizorhabdus argentea]|uniref:endonuclease domain-containing protein n=1 Tax=Rhizorhabdus argentea TaxID=1387174 RepID=UPI0030EC7137